VVKSGYSEAAMKLETIMVFGVTNGGPSKVTVNGQQAVFDFNADTKVFLSHAHTQLSGMLFQ